MSLKRNELLESVKKKLSIQVNSYRHFHIKSEGNKETINDRYIVYIYMYMYVCIYIYAVLFGEGNGNSLQCSCLENPRDGKLGGLPSMGSHRVGHD